MPNTPIKIKKGTTGVFAEDPSRAREPLEVTHPNLKSSSNSTSYLDLTFSILPQFTLSPLHVNCLKLST